MPDKGFSPAPNIEPPSRAPSTSSGPFNLGPPDPVGPNPKTPFNLGPPDPVGPNPKAPFEPKISPDQVREPNKFSIGDTLKNIARKALPRVAGGVIANVLDPEFLGGQQAPSKADDEMSPQKGFALSQPSGTITNPKRGFNQSNNMQQPAQYSPDMVSTDRIRDLAGIGRK